MPQPAEVHDLADRLAAMYSHVLDEVEGEIERVAAGLETNPLYWRQEKRLAEVQARLVSLLDQTDAQASQYLRRAMPQVYGAGARAAASSMAVDFGWAQPHVDAISMLTDDLFGELLAATSFVRDDVKRAIADVIRDRALSKVTIGRTANQAAAEAAAILREQGIGQVIYRNGARVGIDTYAQMAMRSKTAIAYSAGTINMSIEQGVTFMEVFDGASCGWIGHDDVDEANGSIRPVEECAQVAISHPNCRRSFGPRPDITSLDGARAAVPSTTEAQRADSAAFEARIAS